MKQENSLTHTIDSLTNWLMGVIIAIPFILSFASLRDLASVNGVSWAWLYPLMVDGGLLIFKAIVLRGALHGKRDWYAWSMAGSATVISVMLNVLHVPGTLSSLWLARFMAALPPVVMLAAFVAVSRRVEEKAKEDTAVFTLGSIIAKTKTARLEHEMGLKKMAEEYQVRLGEFETAISEKLTLIDTLTLKASRLEDEIDTLQREKRSVKTTTHETTPPDGLTADQQTWIEIIKQEMNKNLTAEQAAVQLGVSRSTYFRNKKSLIAGLNGSAVEVLK